MVVLLAGMIEGIANQQHDFFNKKTELYKLNLASIADSISRKENLVLVNGGDNPQLIYLTHRKGWSCEDSKLLDTTFVQDLTQQGCRYIFVDRHSFQHDLAKQKVYQDENFAVYKTN